MNPVISTVARPGYVVALLALTLGVAFLITGSAEGAAIIMVLEGALWACLQYRRARRGERLKPLA